MNHFKTLALGTALLLTATVETQATCVTCPTGPVDFSCSNNKCSGQFSDSTLGTWFGQASNTPVHFVATLATGTAAFSSTGITCSYAATSTQPAVTLTWMPSMNSTVTCEQDTSLCPNSNTFSCLPKSTSK